MLEEKSQAVSALEGEVAALGEERESMQQQLHQLQQQKDELSATIERRDREISSTSTALAQEQLSRTVLEERLASLAKTLGQSNEKVRTTTVDLEAAQDSWKAEHQKVEDLEGQLQVLKQEREATERSSQELEAKCRASEQEQHLRATAESEREELRRKYENVQQFLDSASRDIGLLTTALSEEKEKRERSEERLNAALRKNENKDRAIQALSEERATLAGESNGQKNPSGGIIPLPPVPSQEQQQADDAPQEPRDNLPRPPHEALKEKEPEPLLPPPTVVVQIPEPAQPVQLPQTAAPETVGTAAEPQNPLPVPENPVPENESAAPTPSLESSQQPADWVVNRNLWFDMIKWVHHTTSVPEEQRKSLLSDLMKMSRLVQQGRHLTTRQETDMRSLLARMKALGYRFP
jgi:hypothetical protein